MPKARLFCFMVMLSFYVASSNMTTLRAANSDQATRVTVVTLNMLRVTRATVDGENLALACVPDILVTPLYLAS